MKHLTKEDLEEMGVIHLKSKIYPKRFFVPCVGEVNLEEPYNLEDLLLMAYRSGESYGLERGKREKEIEVQKALGLYTD